MRRLRAWFVRLGATLRPGRHDRDLADELNGHLELAIAENLRAGMDANEAHRRALIDLGGMTCTSERWFDRSRLQLLDSILRDARYTMRRIRQAPGFTLACIAIIALGIGASTAIFSIVDAVLLKPLPYPDGDRIVTLSYKTGDAGSTPMAFQISIPDLEDWQRQAKTFDAMAYYQQFRTSVRASTAAEYATVSRVGPHFLEVFGMTPDIGRRFTASEERPQAGSVALVSAQYVLEHFADSSHAIGARLSMFGRELTIIGVVPSTRGFPVGTDIWTPAVVSAHDRTDRGAQNYLAVGRVKHNVPLKQAQAEIATIASRLASAYPATNAGTTVFAAPLIEFGVMDARRTLYLLFAAVGLLLLIACANVATLLLMKATSRSHEIATRTAVGASRTRVVGQLVVEGVVHAVLAGTIGLVLATLAVRGLVAVAPAGIPRLENAHVDGRVLLFATLVSVLVGVLFALPAALHAAKPKVDGSTSLRGRSIAVGRRRIRELLVAGEIALTVVLLVGAGLLVRSLLMLEAVPLGFQPDHVLVMEATVPVAGANAQTETAYFRQLLSGISTVPGVTAAGATMSPPGAVDSTGHYWIDRQADLSTPTQGVPTTINSVIAPATFTALGIPITSGRDFRDADTREAPNVAIINEALARKAFGAANPIGHSIVCGFDSFDAMTIVGVVGDVHQWGPETPATTECFMPYTQHWFNRNSLFVVVRTEGEQPALAETIRRIARQTSPDVSVRLTTMEAFVGLHTVTPRFRALLAMAFGVIALILAIAGLYAVMGEAVGERAREIGLRMAIGAQPSQIGIAFLSNGLLLAAGGIALGVAFALSLGRYASGVLFGIPATDATTFGVVIALTVAITVVASLIPARRAMNLDPAATLRNS